MRNEESCKSNEKYLFTSVILSDESIDIFQNESNRRLKNEPKGELFEKFNSWVKKENEVALLTLYAYADFKIPKSFDCIFDLDNPDCFLMTQIKLTQSIWEGWVPIDSIEDGHKHICIFEFENGIPKIINKLYISKGKYLDSPNKSFRLGICNSTDFNSIKNRIEYIKGLKKQHEKDWWKFDKNE